MASVCINGENKETNSSTISELLVELSLADKKVAVEVNKEIVPRDSYKESPISTGDKIEIVHFVGGG